MKMPDFRIDVYNLRARYAPIAVVALPLSLAALTLWEKNLSILSVIWGVFWACGGMVVASQLGRDLGKRKEPWLYNQWGGMPSIRLLRHRDSRNKVQLERWHNKLQEIVPDIKIPSENQEIKDPKRADYIYDACGSHLRNNTRDKNKFPLVFEENCNYGFRRNLWGMRLYGLIFAIAGSLLLVAYILHFVFSNEPVPNLAKLTMGINCLLLLGWVFIVNPDWVRTAAEAYGLRLIESCEIIEVSNNKK